MVNRIVIMKKIKLIQTILINDKSISYFDILNSVNNLKNKTQTELRKSGLEDRFTVVVEVINCRNSIEIITT